MHTRTPSSLLNAVALGAFSFGLGVLVTLVTMCVVQAADLTPMHARTLIVIAHGETGLPLPETMPTVEIVDEARMQALACTREGCRPPKAMAIEGRVYALDSLDWSDPAVGIIGVHEFVHVLQWHAAGAVTDCAEWVRREKQAWDVTVKLLRQSGRATMQAEMARAGIHCA